MGNLEVTKENVHSFPAVNEIYGHLTIGDGVTLVAPSLTLVRGWVTIEADAQLIAKNLGLIDGWLMLMGGLNAIHLLEVRQDMTVGAASYPELPALSTVGSLNMQRDAAETFPSLATVRENLTLLQSAELTVPVLKQVGRSITLRENTRLDAPELAHIGGYYDGDVSAVFVAPKFIGG